jgi:ABC-type nickel/cobalt efflux system permease component RcnA
MEHAMKNQHGRGSIFGFPLEGFSLFQGVLLSVASAFFTFFAVTAIAIFALLIWNAGSAHKINFADSYLYAGFPAGVLVLLIALPYFLSAWFRSKMHR